MSKEANFGQLIEMCNSLGWHKGIAYLEKIVYQNENAQVYMIENGQQKQANKLSQVIIKQSISIGKLKQYRKENQL